jgi:hypothetical protein
MEISIWRCAPDYCRLCLYALEDRALEIQERIQAMLEVELVIVRDLISLQVIAIDIAAVTGDLQLYLASDKIMVGTDQSCRKIDPKRPLVE